MFLFLCRLGLFQIPSFFCSLSWYTYSSLCMLINCKYLISASEPVELIQLVFPLIPRSYGDHDITMTSIDAEKIHCELNYSNKINAKQINTPMPCLPSWQSHLVKHYLILKNSIHIGSLQCLSFSRPDIVYAVNKLSKYMNRSTTYQF